MLQKTEKTSVFSGLDRNVWILTATSFLTDISSDMIANLVPLFLTGVLGQATAVVGLIEGVAEATASLTKVFSGALSDRLDRRKSLAVLGYGLSTLAKPLLYFANSWGVVLGVRFSDRLGKGIRSAPKDALLSLSVSKEQRGLAFGIHRVGDTAGAFIGILIAALIIWGTQSNPEVLSAQTFRIVALASILPAMLAVVVLALGAHDVAPARAERADDGISRSALEEDPSTFPPASPSASPSTSLRMPPRMTPRRPPGMQPGTQSGRSFWGWREMDRGFLIFLAITVIFTLGNSSDAFIILLGKQRGLSVLGVMGMLLTFNAVYTVLAGPAGALSDRIGRRRLIVFGWLAYGLIYLGFSLAKTGATTWLFFGLYGVYYALFEGASKAFIADLVPPDQRGSAYGLYAAAVGLMAFPASLIAGLLWQGLGAWKGFGPSAPFLFGGGLALIATLLFGVWMPGKIVAGD